MLDVTGLNLVKDFNLSLRCEHLTRERDHLKEAWKALADMDTGESLDPSWLADMAQAILEHRLTGRDLRDFLGRKF